jgi:hypothetical protein
MIPGRSVYSSGSLQLVVAEIEALEQEDKKTIVKVIDSLLKDTKVKKAYATQQGWHTFDVPWNLTF